jgi:hypothetical protein
MKYQAVLSNAKTASTMGKKRKFLDPILQNICRNYAKMAKPFIFY